MKKDLKSFIVPTVLSNTDLDYKTGNRTFNTKDFVFLESYDEINAYNQNSDQLRVSTTDWCLVNEGFHSLKKSTLTGKQGTASYWLRSASVGTEVRVIKWDGEFNSDRVNLNAITICPSLCLDIEAVVDARKESSKNFKISTVKDPAGKELYHTIEFGQYPKTYVGDKLNNFLNGNASPVNASWHRWMMPSSTRKPTGKKYTAYIDDNGKPVYYPEYEYNGQKYVCVKIKRWRQSSCYSDRTLVPESGNIAWIKVEPIVWKIRNWDDMPKVINPKGNGSAKVMRVTTEESIARLPFYPNTSDDYGYLWQNSTIRGYLNGLNVNNIQTNGNVKYNAPNGGDFSSQNFFTEALDSTIQFVLAEEQEEQSEKDARIEKKNVYGVSVLKQPMNINEQIRFYIEKGKSFMLHGASGVGKTRRIEEIDPDFVSIVLRNGMLPEEVIGKTIYPNGDISNPSVWMSPVWYTNLCNLCEKEPDKNHVLFIDEITNVKPSEQSLVYNLVLTRSIGPNIGKLPKNVVVVAAGNTKQESEAAYNMPEPLFRRFEGHVEIIPDIISWLEWGAGESGKGEGRLKIHPLVANFVAAFSEQVFYSPYDSEEPPKFAIDPRGWEQVSDIIYDNNGVIAQELIENKIGAEIAQSFVFFAEQNTISVEDIVKGKIYENDIPQKIDEQYAFLYTLRFCTEEQFPKVLEFVKKNFYTELAALFVKIWVGNSAERAIFADGQTKPKVEEKEL